MSRSRRLFLFVIVAAVGTAGWIGYGVLRTLRRIPEAYAAWDTGTLLIDYMERNEDRWPTSWDDLIATVSADPPHEIVLRGTGGEKGPYLQSLRKIISVDWSFDPSHAGLRDPVSRPDGSRFPTVWSGGEPNEMIRRYLGDRASTRPAAVH